VAVTSPTRAQTLPWSWYWDPEVLRREERLFTTSWQYVGPLEKAAEPGQFFTARCGPVPVVVVRDETGVVRGFVNVCRHRGTLVASGEGRCGATLQCPYHAWTYGLDGSLRSAPRSGREEGFDASQLGLLPVEVGSWGPFVFANASLGAPPLSETLGDLPGMLAEAGVDVERLRFRRRSSYQLAANWKIAVENYLECYHCPVAHPGFTAVMEVAPERYQLSEAPTFVSHLAPARQRPLHTPYPLEGPVGVGSFHLVWPNLKVNVNPGQPNLSIGPLLPEGPEHCAGFLYYFFAETVDDDWVESFIAFDDQVGAEDRSLVEAVQQGMRCGVLDEGRLLLDSEWLIAAFQAYVRRECGDRAGPGSP
jgi:choline monooxygenase